MSSCEAVHKYCGNVFAFSGASHLLPDCNAVTSITNNHLPGDDVCNKIPSKCKLLLYQT